MSMMLRSDRGPTYTCNHSAVAVLYTFYNVQLDWLLFNVIRNKRTCTQWRYRRWMQYSDKNERKKTSHVLKEMTNWHKWFSAHLRVTSGQFIHVSFESEVMVTRYNRRKYRLNTMTGISRFTSSAIASIVYKQKPYMYIQCVSKNIPNIFSYNSKKHCRVFIIFGTLITEKAGNQ